MPGVRVNDGEVEVQGEKIEKVFVDGKEFFGQDVNTAIKNLPAVVVKEVEVYDELSDQAKFSGVDDGEGFKAMNIVTEVNRGHFGRVYGGYGFNDKYTGGGNLNMFSGDTRLSVLGMGNNTNQQNFSNEDILGAMGGGGRGRGGRGRGNFMVGSQPGVSTVQSAGLNYNDIFGKSKKLEVSASYFFNNSKFENTRFRERENIGDIESYLLNRDSSDYVNRNSEHRFNARVEYKISDSQTLMWRPSFSYQRYKNMSDNWGQQYSVRDGEENLISRNIGLDWGRNTGYNISNMLVYRLRLGKPGRTISAHASMRYSRNDSKGLSDNRTIREEGEDIDNRQRNNSETKRQNWDANIMYTEPIAKNLQLNAAYRISYDYSDLNRDIEVWDPLKEVFFPSEERSSLYNSGYLTQSVGPGINYNKDRNVFTANVQYQHARLANDQELPTALAGKKRYTFEDAVYFAMANIFFNPETSLRIFARSNTNNPSVTQLQDVVSDSDQLNISTGNPNLKPSYSHRIFSRFLRSNIEKGRTFTLMGGFNYQTDNISNYTIINSSDQIKEIPISDNKSVQLLPGGRFSRPINLDGNWSADAGISYGIPVDFIKSNLNFDLRGRYGVVPSIYDEQKNKQKTQSYTAGFTLGSNISEKIDFTVRYNAGYNIVNNNRQVSTNGKKNNEYFTQNLSTSFKFEFWEGFSISGNALYAQYKGITDKDYNEDYTIVNLYLGKKLFKRRGELTFGVNDLFDKENGYVRNIADTYIEDVHNRAIGRYFGFQFVYHIRSFSGNGGGFSGTPSSLRGPGGGHGGGRPPGGGRRM